jgi:hypothetical protein
MTKGLDFAPSTLIEKPVVSITHTNDYKNVGRPAKKGMVIKFELVTARRNSVNRSFVGTDEERMER